MADQQSPADGLTETLTKLANFKNNAELSASAQDVLDEFNNIQKRLTAGQQPTGSSVTRFGEDLTVLAHKIAGFGDQGKADLDNLQNFASSFNPGSQDLQTAFQNGIQSGQQKSGGQQQAYPQQGNGQPDPAPTQGNPTAFDEKIRLAQQIDAAENSRTNSTGINTAQTLDDIQRTTRAEQSDLSKADNRSHAIAGLQKIKQDMEQKKAGEHYETAWSPGADNFRKGKIGEAESAVDKAITALSGNNPNLQDIRTKLDAVIGGLSTVSRGEFLQVADANEIAILQDKSPNKQATANEAKVVDALKAFGGNNPALADHIVNDAKLHLKQGGDAKVSLANDFSGIVEGARGAISGGDPASGLQTPGSTPGQGQGNGPQHP